MYFVFIITETFHFCSSSSRELKSLRVRGLKKRVVEADLQAVFPQASSIAIHRGTGEATLDYDLEEDCLVDYQNARSVKLFGHKLVVSRVATMSTTATKKTDPDDVPDKRHQLTKKRR